MQTTPRRLSSTAPSWLLLDCWLLCIYPVQPVCTFLLYFYLLNPQYTIPHILFYSIYNIYSSFFLHIFMYILLCCVTYLALSIERTWPDIHFTTDYICIILSGFFADKTHTQNSQGDFKKSLIAKVKINRELEQKQAETTANRARKQETHDRVKQNKTKS